MPRPKGAKDTKPRKPRGGSKRALILSVAAKDEQQRFKQAKDGIKKGLDSLGVMRHCLDLAMTEIPAALAKVRDLAVESKDAITMLKATASLRLTILDCHTIAKDIAPFEHRRLAGEKPLEKEDTGPATALIIDAERAL